ncbi:MAG: hypothetical protein IPP88_16950 [Betaproteobacteria bacterium]|nr:hypothetical protein [Betaproteobacteria bacterium]
MLPLNFTLNGNSFTAVPNQIGVYGTLTTENQSEVGATAFRIVTVTARDSTGKETTATYNVLQSFLTGYGLSIQTAASCSASGEDSLISLVP